MPTIYDGDATTWRDLADALTPSQVDYLKDWERHPELPPRADGTARSDDEHQEALLFTAREFVGSNAAGAVFADVPPPPDAGQHYPWQETSDGGCTRFFVGTSRKLGGAEVLISGIQCSDGSISRSITANATEDMDATEARQLARLILEAADELDGLEMTAVKHRLGGATDEHD